jgi:hypothetical protein
MFIGSKKCNESHSNDKEEKTREENNSGNQVLTERLNR